MGRTRLSAQRLTETRQTNIGRIIIFCEGKTEKHYFDYFSEIISKNKFTSVRVEVKTASGNAKTVLNFANEFLADEEHNRVYTQYGKYLVFDCDEPPDIQAVITQAIYSDNQYNLLISNYLFETWLLMHFEDVEQKLSKREIYKRMADYLNINKNYSKVKGKKGIVRKIINDGNIE